MWYSCKILVCETTNKCLTRECFRRAYFFPRQSWWEVLDKERLAFAYETIGSKTAWVYKAFIRYRVRVIGWDISCVERWWFVGLISFAVRLISLQAKLFSQMRFWYAGFEGLLSQMNNFRVDVLPKYLCAKTRGSCLASECFLRTHFFTTPITLTIFVCQKILGGWMYGFFIFRRWEITSREIVAHTCVVLHMLWGVNIVMMD